MIYFGTYFIKCKVVHDGNNCFGWLLYLHAYATKVSLVSFKKNEGIFTQDM